MTGWELEGTALDALGEAANDWPLVLDCRVRACREPVERDGMCNEHDTPAVRAMTRPHLYVFNGRRIVLESRPWDELDDDPAPAAPVVHGAPGKPPAPCQAAIPTHVRVDDERPRAPALVHGESARPCWAWCGRPGPAPGCHPASRFSPAPTFPCLACGRELHACQAAGLCCRGPCTEFFHALRFLAPAETAARWLSADEHEAWEERAATLQEATRMPRDAADRRALALVWRASRGPSPHMAAPETPTSAAPERRLERPCSPQLNLF